MIQENHIESIVAKVNQSGIKNQLLKDDLIDHFSCLVEIEMSKGKSFEDAWRIAHDQTSPNGLEEIEKETIFLLNLKRILIMKKLTYLTGYIFSVVWIIGILFKLLHQQGAMVLMMAGMLGFSFIFLPLFMINYFKQKIPSILSDKMKWIFGVLSVILLSAGWTFKVAHLPGANVMIGLAFLLFSFGFLPFLFFRMYRKSIESI
jgi:hypothetical protein